MCRGLLDDAVKDGPHAPFALRVPGLLGVGRVGQEQVDAAPARLFGQTVQIGRAPVQRRLVDLEVARVQDAPVRGVDDHRHAVRDRVRHAQEPHGEWPDGRRSFPRRHHVEFTAIRHAVLFELALEQRERECRPVDGDVAQLAEQVRQGADVILVTVREHHGLDLIGALADVIEVREHEVDAEHVRGRERQADVDKEDALVQLDAGHVSAHLADATEEDDANVRVRGDRHPPAPCGPACAPPTWRGRAGASAPRPGVRSSPGRPSTGSGCW